MKAEVIYPAKYKVNFSGADMFIDLAKQNHMFTELDISLLPFPEGEEQGANISVDVALQERFNPYPNGLPSEINKQLNSN